MILTNYHTHNELCDGKGAIREYVESAVRKGFTALGFSSHAPLPVKNDWCLPRENLGVYLEEVERRRVEWAGRIQIYRGLEIDYISPSAGPGDAKWGDLNLDFRIGSVHTTAALGLNPEYRCVDGPVADLEWLIEHVHGGSFENLSEAYFRRVAEMVRIGGLDFVGHLDLIKKRNREGGYFSEDARWYRRHVLGALDAVEKSGVIMEVNTGGISRGVLDTVYPSPWILAEAGRRGIQVMVNSDAHRPGDIDCYFEESWALLREAGYREVQALLDGGWRGVSLG